MTPEKWLQKKIQERGIKQSFLADKLGTTEGKLSNRMTGRVRMEVPMFLGACRLIGIDPMDYLTEATAHEGA